MEECGMSTINLNYDSKFDVLYARLCDYAPSYGDDENGIVTYYSIATDAVTGMAIYNVKSRVQSGEMRNCALPIPIDLYSMTIQTLLNHPEKGFRCTLRLS